MNNKGQTLVFFVALFPVILIIFAFVFDSAYMIMEKNKLNDISKTSIKYLVEDNKDIDKIKEIVYKNDDQINIINIKENNVHLKKNLDPIFGKIIGFDNYEIESNINGYIENNKLIIKEKGN